MCGNRQLRQRGFSLVELMVAILIGLIILAGVVQVVVTSRTTFFGQEEMSFIQENARYAVDVIGRDIQSAGYWGCAGPTAKTAMVATVSEAAAPFLAHAALRGFDGDDVPNMPAVFRGEVREAEDAADQDILPDAILLRGLAGPTRVVARHDATGEITLTEPHNFNAGEYLAVVAEDCQRLGVFRAGAVDETAIEYGAAGNFSTNIMPSLDKSIVCTDISDEVEDEQPVSTANCTGAPSAVQVYTNAATVTSYRASAYYIGDSIALGADVPALRRAVLRNGTAVNEEIALGVENMRITYGEREGNNLIFREADVVEDWTNVASVRVELLFRSQTPVLPEDQLRNDLLGNTYNDRFARQVVSSTFRLRNRF